MIAEKKIVEESTLPHYKKKKRITRMNECIRSDDRM